MNSWQRQFKNQITYEPFARKEIKFDIKLKI